MNLTFWKRNKQRNTGSGPVARPPYRAGDGPDSLGWWKLYDAFDREVCASFGIGAERDIKLISDAMNAYCAGKS
jgi:hypothetical protein